jgi:hypothetical protein
MEEVLASKRVMDQSLFGAAAGMLPALADGGMEDEVAALSSRLVDVEDSVADVAAAVRRLEQAQARLQAQAEQDRAALAARHTEAIDALRAGSVDVQARVRMAVWLSVVAVAVSVAVAALSSKPRRERFFGVSGRSRRAQPIRTCPIRHGTGRALFPPPLG